MKIMMKRRELLLKLAETEEQVRRLPAGKANGLWLSRRHVDIVYDLRQNTMAEMQTFFLAQVLRYSILAEKRKIPILPKFVSFKKSGSEVTLRL